MGKLLRIFLQEYLISCGKIEDKFEKRYAISLSGQVRICPRFFLVSINQYILPREGLKVLLQTILAIFEWAGLSESGNSGLHDKAKQSCHELVLCLNISLSYPYNLSLPNHVHRFIALNCPPGRRIREEPQTWLDLSLHKPMILLDDVVHIFAGPALAFSRK